MSDNWGVFFRQFDDCTAAIRIDLEAGLERDNAAHPALLRIELPCDTVEGEEINPTRSEWRVLEAVEEEATRFVEKASGVLVAAVMYPGRRVFFSYLPKNAANEEDVRAALAKWKGRDMKIELQPDPEWAVYFNSLYPDDEDMQWIADSQLVQYLSEQGDQLETPRPVEFTALFPSQADCDRFADAAALVGFCRCPDGAEGPAETDPDLDEPAMPFSITLTRETAVDLESISPLTLELHRLAKANNGQFDGWACFLPQNERAGARHSDAEGGVGMS